MGEQNTEQQSPEAIISVEDALASLWDKAREASLLISTLREEKKQLLKKIHDLDEEIGEMKSANLLQQTQLASLRQDLDAAAEKKSGTVALDTEERLALQKKIKTIILKIDQYLAP